MDPILYGLLVTLFGMVTVFAVLMLLWGVLALMRPLFSDKTATKQAPVENAPAPVVASVSAVNIVAEEDSEELIAVITAAINACMGSQSNLVVRRITRVSDNTPVWGQIARNEQMLNRI